MTEDIKKIKYQRLNPKPMVNDNLIDALNQMSSYLKNILNENYQKSLSVNCDKKYRYLSDEELNDFLELRKKIKKLSYKLTTK